MSKNTQPTDAQVLDALRTIAAFLSGGATPTPVVEEEAAPAPAPAKRGRKAAAPASEPEPEEDEDEEDEEDEEEQEEEGGLYDPEELAGKSLRALKTLAVEAGYDRDDLAGYDKDALIELLTTPEEEEGEEEDEEESEDEDEDENFITIDDLKAMSLAELKTLAKEEGVTVKTPATKDAIIDALLALG